MKNRKSRILSFVLAVTLIASLFAGFTANATYYGGDFDKNLTWSLETSTGELTISGEGYMVGYDYYTAVPWKDHLPEIKSVIISKGVAGIGKHAFESCSELRSVTIPDSVKSIGSYAFAQSMLSSVNIPSSVTNIGKGTFYGCSRLTSVDIPSSVTSIGIDAFAFCIELTSVDVPSSITNIGKDAFNRCDKLETVYYNGTEAQWNAIDIDNAFGEDVEIVFLVDSIASGECGDNLTWSLGANGVLTISGTGNMTDYLYSYDAPWYSYSSSIKSVTIGSGVTSIGSYAFEFCGGLTSITIPSSVTSIGEAAFFGCDGLTSITIPDGVTSIGDSAFACCYGLTSISIPDSVTSISGWAFGDCECESITVASGNSVYKSENNCLIEKATNTLIRGCKNSVIPSSVTSIGEYAFGGCYGLTSITIPNSVTSIGDWAFSGCDGLTSITIGSGVTSIGDGAFGSCSGLKTVYYGGTLEQKKSISIGSNNSDFSSADWVFTQCSDGHHYDNACDTTCNVCGETRTTSHVYDNACDTTCNVCGATRTITHDYAEAWSNDSAQHWHECSVCHDKTDVATHTYDNACDTTCNVCGATRVTEHVYDNDFDTACNVCGSERTVTDVSGTYGESCIFDYTDADKTLTLSGTAADALTGIDAPWKSIANKIAKVVVGKTVAFISGSVFEGLSPEAPIYVMGDPEIEDGALPKNNSIFGWSGTKLQNYCSANENAFTALEEFTALGYQVGAAKSNMFRVIAQMRYADYYEAAGFDITAVGSDGFGHDFNKSLTQNISKVYKSVSASSPSGVQYTAVTAEDGCYLSAFGMTGLPEMAAGAKIVFTVTPFVYNIFSGEKVSLDPVMLQYTADGISQYIEESSGLKTDEGTTEGGVINWNEI